MPWRKELHDLPTVVACLICKVNVILNESGHDDRCSQFFELARIGKWANVQHFSLIASILGRRFVLVLNEMVLVLDGCWDFEYEYEYRRGLSTSTKTQDSSDILLHRYRRSARSVKKRKEVRNKTAQDQITFLPSKNSDTGPIAG